MTSMTIAFLAICLLPVGHFLYVAIREARDPKFFAGRYTNRDDGPFQTPHSTDIIEAFDDWDFGSGCD